MLPQRSAEIKIEWLGGGGPWVSCKLSQRSAGVYTYRLQLDAIGQPWQLEADRPPTR